MPSSASSEEREKALLEAYPERCPFCAIAAAYPHAAAPPHHISPAAPPVPTIAAPSVLSKLRAEATTPPSPRPRRPYQGALWLARDHGQAQRQVQRSRGKRTELLRCVPRGEAADPGRVQPRAFVVLSAERVVAFLDILPMTRGHLLVTTRGHREKVGDLAGCGEEGRDVGFWLPLLAKTVAKVTEVTDYNIVQNNGVRAAQVVPHVHFHIIPRPTTMPELKNKSWTMFGRGQRDDLDDDEAAALAEEMRKVLREELENMEIEEKSKL